MAAVRHVTALMLVALFALLAANQGVSAQGLRKILGMVRRQAEAQVDDFSDEGIKAAEDEYADQEAVVDLDLGEEEAERQEDYGPPPPTTPRPGFFQTFTFPPFPTFPTLPPFPGFPSAANVSHALAVLNVTGALTALGVPLPAGAIVVPVSASSGQPHRPHQHPSSEQKPHASPKPPQRRPTIVATKTIFVEVTSRVTRHPICVTVNGIRPPCLPHGDYSADNNDIWREEPHQEGNFYIEPTAVVGLPAATATPDLGVDAERDARYLELKPRMKASQEAAVAAKEEAPATGEKQELSFAVIDPSIPSLVTVEVDPGTGNLGLLANNPHTVIVSKTLWVTKVERVTDYRVTATLVAQNCVPSHLNIPACQDSHHHHHHEQEHEHINPPKPHPTPYRPRPTTHRPRPPHHHTTPKPNTTPYHNPNHYPTAPNHYPTAPNHYPTTPNHYPTTPKPAHRPRPTRPHPTTHHGDAWKGDEDVVEQVDAAEGVDEVLQ